MKKFLTITLIALSLIVFTACGDSKKSTTEPTTDEPTTDEPTDEPTDVSVTNPSPESNDARVICDHTGDIFWSPE